jgi:autotransporter-associated beta strand protein
MASKLNRILLLACVLFTTGVSYGACTIELSNSVLLPNLANQEIFLKVTGTDLVTGVDLRAQIGDGMGPQNEPKFLAVNFAGGMWDSFPTMTSGSLIAGYEQYAQFSVIFSQCGQKIPANGIIAKLRIDTTGISAGEFSLALKNTDIGADTVFIGTGGSDIGVTDHCGSLAIVSGPVWCGNSTSDGNWNSSLNWNPALPQAGNSLIFEGTKRLSTNNNFTPGTQWKSLWFRNSAGAFTLAGNAIQLSGNIINTSTNLQTINLPVNFHGNGNVIQASNGPIRITANVDNGGNTLSFMGPNDISISCVLSGAGGLIKSDSGALNLTGSLTYTGDTTVDGGTLIVGALTHSSHVTVLGTLNATSLVCDTLTIGSPDVASFASFAVPEPTSILLLSLAFLTISTLSIKPIIRRYLN